MALPQNALTNLALTTGTISVFVQTETFDWRTGQTTIQWFEIVQNGNGIWQKNPNNPNPQVAVLAATIALSVAYAQQTVAARLAQVKQFYIDFYNNLNAASAGTAQPVLF